MLGGTLNSTNFVKHGKLVQGCLSSSAAWATAVQACVTTIRQAAAMSQIILLPGNNYTSAQTFVPNGSGPALLKVTNPGGSTTNLVFDVRK